MAAKKKSTKKTPDSKAIEQAAASSIEAILSSVQARFGTEAARRLGDSSSGSYEAISTGSARLDMALGIGGLPRGRIVEIYGPESSGKTTLTLHVIAEAQRRGLHAAFIDAEHALDPGYAAAIGVDLDNLLFSQPDYGEQALDITDMLVRAGAHSVVVVDSVAALTPKAELDGEMTDQHVGLQARMMSKAMRRLAAAASRSNTLVIFINQLRQKIGVRFGSPETTPGGNALKFYASIRLDVRRIGQVKQGEETTGVQTRVKVVKSKVGAPFRQVEFDIAFGKGIDVGAELLDLGVEHGVIEKSGSWYSYGEKRIGNGRAAAVEHVSEHPGLADAIRRKVGL